MIFFEPLFKNKIFFFEKPTKKIDTRKSRKVIMKILAKNRKQTRKNDDAREKTHEGKMIKENDDRKKEKCRKKKSETKKKTGKREMNVLELIFFVRKNGGKGMTRNFKKSSKLKRIISHFLKNNK